MCAYRVVVRVEEGHERRFAAAVQEACPGASLARRERAGGTTYATFHVRTHEAQNSVSARLHNVRGVSVVRVSGRRTGRPYRPRMSKVVALAVAAWAGFLAVCLLPGSPLLVLNQAQLFAVQASFTTVVAVLLYARDRDAVDRATSAVDGIRMLADEINERVKVLAERIR